MTNRRSTFRLYPTPAQLTKLMDWRRLHAYLYNAAVSNRLTQFKHFKHKVTYLEQQNCLPAFKKVWPEFNELGSQALQATLKRVDLAFERVLQNRLSGNKSKARYRGIRHYSGWTYPAQSGWKAQTDGKHGNLILSNLGSIRMRGQARTWAKPKTCTLFYRSGQWFVSFTADVNLTRSTQPDSVGIDLGCKEAITLSTGEQIPKPDFIKSGRVKVKQASKKLKRRRAPNRKKKVKASRRWKRERAVVSRIQRKVTRQREDWLHQTTSNIVSRYSLVAGERLNIKGMTASAKKGKRKKQKTGLNRSILEVGMGQIGLMLGYKLAEAGGFYVESPTKTLKPTQRCAVCWELTPKLLSDRVHQCSSCGHTADRDINAAQVNLIWAKGLGTSLSDSELSSSTLGSDPEATSSVDLSETPPSTG